MKHRLYKMECITNLHVGSGESTFSLVDNEVQRDVITSAPIIRSSGLKGALREFVVGKTKNNDDILNIFGGVIEKDDKKISKQGTFSFYDAKILAMPVRATSQPYYMGTSDRLIKDFLNTINTFGIEFDNENDHGLDKLCNLKCENAVVFKGNQNTSIELIKAVFNETKIDKAVQILGGEVALIEDEKLDEIFKELPVIARNHLVNGESKNLWYEEVVPRKSIFYFVISGNDNALNDLLTGKNELVQVGANATIGYGLTKISLMGESKNEQKKN